MRSTVGRLHRNGSLVPIHQNHRAIVQGAGPVYRDDSRDMELPRQNRCMRQGPPCFRNDGPRPVEQRDPSYVGIGDDQDISGQQLGCVIRATKYANGALNRTGRGWNPCLLYTSPSPRD